MKKFLKHLKTIVKHKHAVMKCCFKMGIPLRGILHDLSKFTWKEFSIYKFYNGKRSPHEVAREKLGYSPSWLYHKSKNKHHWEYWLDNETKEFIPIKIPYKYAIEMVCDFIGAGKVYMNEKWTPSAPLEYHNKTKNNRIYHKDTLKLIEYLFVNIELRGLENFYVWYKNNKKNIRKDYSKEIVIFE